MTKQNAGVVAVALIIALLIVDGALTIIAKDRIGTILGERRLEAQNQVVNRALNVEAWCTGINGGRDYNRLFVRRVTGGRVEYSLTDLPCEALIRNTLESSKQKDAITPKRHPLTYRVLQSR